MPLRKILTAVFYRKPNGLEPVRTWLKLLAKTDKKIIGRDINEVECNWPVGMPKVKYLEKRLWEVRSDITGNRSVRTLFTINNKRMYLVHSFFKNSTKTPGRELEIANERKNEILKKGGHSMHESSSFFK
ncbi:type II toxin-antitoxin system RelE/ParE family toxin [Legionella hackeliae]|nr:type II toxin-antitoxin system RelE/ParE family toxin [Legionella hackeliae]